MLGLALGARAPSAWSAVSWPEGHIVRGAYNGSQGTSKIQFLPASDTTLHVMGYGSPGPAWAGNPVQADGTIGGASYLGIYGFGAPGGAGSLLTLTYSSSALLQLGGSDFNGAALPVTSLTGPINSFSSSDGRTGCLADGGGSWFLWQGGSARPGVRLLRVTPSATVTPGWPAPGRKLANTGAGFAKEAAVIADGNGGALVLLGQDVMRAFRVNADTTVAPGWTSAGLALEAPYLDYSFTYQSRLVRADETHFIAFWSGLSAEGWYFKCQRFALDGTLDPAWPADGVVVRDPYASGANVGGAEFEVVADGAGGATMGWVDSLRVRVRHVLADGTYPPAYAAGPLPLADLTGTPMTSQRFGLARGRTGGCAVVFASADGSLRGRWFDGDAAPDPGPVVYDKVFFTYAQLVAADAGYYLRGNRSLGATGDSDGGVFAGWNGTDAFGYTNYLFATHAAWPGTPYLDVPPRAPAALALAAGPNPARGTLTAHFSLPDARPARLELLDLAGRRVALREAAGAGQHAVQLGEAAALPPGVYLLRLSHGGVTSTARVALVR